MRALGRPRERFGHPGSAGRQQARLERPSRGEQRNVRHHQLLRARLIASCDVALLASLDNKRARRRGRHEMRRPRSRPPVVPPSSPAPACQSTACRPTAVPAAILELQPRVPTAPTGDSALAAEGRRAECSELLDDGLVAAAIERRGCSALPSESRGKGAAREIERLASRERRGRARASGAGQR